MQLALSVQFSEAHTIFVFGSTCERLAVGRGNGASDECLALFLGLRKISVVIGRVLKFSMNAVVCA